MGKTVALVGPPNVGKTTLMSRLCGVKVEVGNWPGVTVERKTCRYEHGNTTYKIVDLPGLYSLTGSSEDQRVAISYLLGGYGEKPDTVVVVGDPFSLERSVALLMEVAELGYHHLVFAVNMMDEARRKGIHVDLDGLEEKLGVPVVGTSAKSGEGVDRLKRAIADVAEGRVEPKPVTPDYPEPIERAVERLTSEHGIPRWAAIRALEGVEEILERLPEGVREEVRDLRRKVEKELGRPVREATEDARRETAYRIVSETVETREDGFELQDRLDKILTHPVYGTVTALTVLAAVFWIAFTLGGFLEDAIDGLLDVLKTLSTTHLHEPFRSLVNQGLIEGVGTVLSLYPYVFLLLLLLTVLEDSGYTARVAALAAPLMARFGLHGKTVFPVAISLSCNVPAVTGTRIIEDPRARLLSAVTIPFVPCSARLAVITFLTAKMPPGLRVPAAVAIYAVALAAFLGSAALLDGLLHRGKRSTGGHVIELPRLRRPHPRTVLTVTWIRSKEFLEKAGTTVLAVSLALWAASKYPQPIGTGRSATEVLGHALATVTGPVLGLGWKEAVALVNGIAAKETVVSTLTMLNAHLSPDKAFVLALVTTLYFPCVATLASLWSETGSLKWPAISLAWSLAVATVIGAAVHAALTLT